MGAVIVTLIKNPNARLANLLHPELVRSDFILWNQVDLVLQESIALDVFLYFGMCVVVLVVGVVVVFAFVSALQNSKIMRSDVIRRR